MPVSVSPTLRPGIGLAAWLMPLGAAALVLIGWFASPGFPLQAMSGETNAALGSNLPRFLAGSVNSVPVGCLMSTLSNAAPSTNISARGWN